MNILRKLFEDKNGHIVIGQRPNLPIIVWAVAQVLTWVPAVRAWHELLSLIAFGSLFTWAWLEIFQGACLFRRLLGTLVMIFLLHSRLML